MDNVYIIFLKWIIILVPSYWLLRPLRAWFIPIASLLFMGFYAPLSVIILLLITLLSYFFSQQKNVTAMMICCGMMLTLFILYKVNLQFDHAWIKDIILLGFSYYLLRAWHYTVESHRLSLPPHSFSQYVQYMLYLPSLAVGPIHRFPDFIRELSRQRWDATLFAQGLKRLVYGYTKLVLLANLVIGMLFSQWLNSIQPTHVSLYAYLSCLQYGLNLYCQFSGYADIAIGFSNLLGMRLMENFNYPFLKHNIMKFWQAWHISLSNWCRDYLYAPISAITRKPVVGIFIAMLGLGLWHELSIRYVLWSLYQGFGIAAYHAYLQIYPQLPTFLHKVLRSKIGILGGWLLTQNYIILSFAITKETSLTQSLHILQTLFGINS